MTAGVSPSRAASAYVYCGTSEFAATILGSLVAGPRPPALVVTPPDRRRGRGRGIAPPPVAERARELGLELHQTDDINSERSRHLIRVVEPELAAVCAFGQLIAEPLLTDLPMLNVHPSLLPRWRGAAPIERAIMAGDDRTGVCVIRLTAGLDSGPVALREVVPIDDGDDYGALSERLAAVGASVLGAALDGFAAGTLELTDQDADGVTYADKVEPAERRVRTDEPASAEALRIRALTPHIGAYVILGGDRRLAVRDAVAVKEGPPPGRFGAAESEELRLLVGCDTGALSIGSVQPQGKRWMTAADYLRGYGIPEAQRRGVG